MNLDQYIHGFKLLRKAFNPLKVIVKDIVAEKDKVTVFLEIKGKHTGIYEHFHASQNEVDFMGVIIRRIANGKVVEEWQVNDYFSMFKQMGISFNHII